MMKLNRSFSVHRQNFEISMKWLCTLTNATCVCPQGHTHEEDNFIVQQDVHKGALYYMCLSTECSPQRTLLIQVNGTKGVEEDFTKKLGVKCNFEAAERVLKLSPHWVCCNDVLYAFDSCTGVWRFI